MKNVPELFGEEPEDDDYEITKEELEDAGGKFFCPKCQVKTNKKSYTTKCLRCGTSLNRLG